MHHKIWIRAKVFLDIKTIYMYIHIYKTNCNTLAPPLDATLWDHSGHIALSNRLTYQPYWPVQQRDHSNNIDRSSRLTTQTMLSCHADWPYWPVLQTDHSDHTDLSNRLTVSSSSGGLLSDCCARASTSGLDSSVPGVVTSYRTRACGVLRPPEMYAYHMRNYDRIHGQCDSNQYCIVLFIANSTF